MIGLLQRVRSASVRVDERLCGEIGVGLLVLIGVRSGDTPAHAARLAQRLLDYRVFPDAQGRMNLSLRDTGAGLLLVPQFTLAADTKSGNRPGFSTAAPPAQAQGLFEQLVAATRGAGRLVAVGEFGAHMQVSLINDGPVTFWLES
jgi:D-tyrosyl-tRNA(Tyr) deacylase